MKMCCKKITVFFNIILSYAFPCCMEFCLCEVDTDQWFALCCEQAYEKKTTPKWRYDLGRRKNFEQVCACCNSVLSLYFYMFCNLYGVFSCQLHKKYLINGVNISPINSFCVNNLGTID